VDRARITYITERAAAVLLACFVILYLVDYASVRIRAMHATPGSPYEDVTLNRLIAVSEKGQKTEYVPAQPQTVTCVHSIFPHMGYDPCWYVNSLQNKPINM
jgi:hypothetical protein